MANEFAPVDAFELSKGSATASLPEMILDFNPPVTKKYSPLDLSLIFVPLDAKHALDFAPVELDANSGRRDGSCGSLENHASCRWVEIRKHPSQGNRQQRAIP